MRFAVAMKTLSVLCLALCAACSSTSGGVRSNVNFDVYSVVTGPDTLRLTAPDGRRLIVVGDKVLVSEIQGVKAMVTRVDDVSEKEAGPAGIEISIASNPASRIACAVVSKSIW